MTNQTPDFRDMMVFGGKVSAQWQREAWRLWLTIGGSMDGCLMKTGPKPGRDAPLRSDDEYPPTWHIAEIRNRMMQRARKTEFAEYRNKRWHATLPTASWLGGK